MEKMLTQSEIDRLKNLNASVSIEYMVRMGSQDYTYCDPQEISDLLCALPAALDTIEEQRVEIERLKAENAELRKLHSTVTEGQKGVTIEPITEEKTMSRATLTLSPEPFEMIVSGILRRGLPPTRDDPGEPPSAELLSASIGVRALTESDMEFLDFLCPGWQTKAEAALLEQAPAKADESDDKYDALKSEGKL